jgi:adenylate cyclase
VTDPGVEHAELLLRVSLTLAQVESLDDVLSALVDIATSATGSERATILLIDESTSEFFFRGATGELVSGLRFPTSRGIAGETLRLAGDLIIDDAYADPRFNVDVDELTGFQTRNLISVPLRDVRGRIIGVAQCINKLDGPFTRADVELLKAITTQASVAIQSNRVIERMRRARAQEMGFLELMSELTSELDLGVLLQRIMLEVSRLLDAERSTLFLHDARTGELFSRVGQGIGEPADRSGDGGCDGDGDGETRMVQLRFPSDVGIAGTVFTGGEAMNIPHAYADLRFNPDFDLQTGFFTRSILCVPVVNKQGQRIGVTEVLNRRGGPFTTQDEQRLRTFTTQVAIALENAKLFEDVRQMKNYNERVLDSMHNGVLTVNADGVIVSCNRAGLELLGLRDETDAIGRATAEVFAPNDWLDDLIARTADGREPAYLADADLRTAGERGGPTTRSVNASVYRLEGPLEEGSGALIVLEDITSEKRARTTLSRYVDALLADQLLADEADVLGGVSTTATVLFSDVRDFTLLAEHLGPQRTVQLLNEYFTLMVGCVEAEGGMLDKYIGDAIMAAFGVPVDHGDDADRAVRAAIAMVRRLREWNVERRAQGLIPIDIGIGISTAAVVAGNVGSPKRMDFTVIGDGVNVASRLEGVCKKFGTTVLINEGTYHQLRSGYRIREFDKVLLKGKSNPVAVYEVLDFHDERSFPNMDETLERFRDGLDAYRNQDFLRGATAFEQALACNPQDAVSRLYLDRCRHLASMSPAGNWDGVWVMSAK